MPISVTTIHFHNFKAFNEYALHLDEVNILVGPNNSGNDEHESGFGFQVWCQLLTHLSRAAGSSLVVIDEPEVYLHPDVQRQLLGTVRDVGAPILMATHSSEIMSEADPSEIVLIDKRRRTGERLKDIAGIQRALTVVGSAQNITLTALARSRRVLFVEGDRDFRLLRRFARRLGMRELGAGLEITPLESGGFGSWERVTTLASGIADALGAPLIIAAIYDRDYFCQEHINHVLAALSEELSLAHVHHRKEIENYLLCPAALDRAIEHASADRQDDKVPPSALDLLCEITDPLKEDVQAQILAKRAEYLRSSGRDLADVNRETLRQFALMWDDLPQRLSLVPGKEVLSSFRARVQQLMGITLSDSRIVNAMRRDDFPEELVGLLTSLDAFRIAAVAQQ